MLINVSLLKGYSEPLTYAIPDSWDPTNLVGSIVRVPFRNYEAPALVTKLINKSQDDYPFTIREALAQEPLPYDPLFRPFLKQLAHYYRIEELFFIKRMRLMLDEHPEPETLESLPADLLANLDAPDARNTHTTPVVFGARTAPVLTAEQQIIVDALAPTITAGAYAPQVIHGVTGSGKTEIYKQLIITAHDHHKTTFFLLPEVSLALRFEELLRTTLPAAIPVLSFHSATTRKNRHRAWSMLLQQQPFVLVGVHLPVTLPCANLGLIIIDEEHETGYQEKKHPKIHTKEAALMRASLYKIPIVLGSATPSLTTLHNVHTKNWQLFELTKRFAGSFPTVQHVLLTDKRQRRSFWISTVLEHAIKDRLLKREQVIIFLNRRGFSLFVQCKACSFTFMCPNCSVSLTLHGTNRLTCHYCGLHQTLPDVCPQCAEKEDQFLKKGIGTQQVVTVLQKLFPMATIGRADLDASSRKTAWKQTLSDFETGKIDIMVGTQTITKGFHFPRVTLVGIIWADLSLNFPVYNATEVALQQIVQVAGRAGRTGACKEPTQSDILQDESSQVATPLKETVFAEISGKETSPKTISPGHVIVQSMIDHPIFAYTREETYKKFYDHEMAARKMAGYPPFMRLAEIEIKHSREEVVERDAHSFAQKLMSQKRVLGLEVFILGPAKPPVHKIQQVHARKIYLKSPSYNDIHTLLDSITTKHYASSISFSPNPQS